MLELDYLLSAAAKTISPDQATTWQGEATKSQAISKFSLP
jgi:hypothetical protein